MDRPDLDDCPAVMGHEAMVFESGGYGPSSVIRHLLQRAAQRATFGSGNGSRSRSGACQQWQPPACLAASFSHAMLVVSGLRAGVANVRDCGALWVHAALCGGWGLTLSLEVGHSQGDAGIMYT